MSARIPNSGWTVSVGLAAIAILAAMLAPRLKPSPPAAEARADAHAEVCVRLGPYECCYDPEAP